MLTWGCLFAEQLGGGFEVALMVSTLDLHVKSASLKTLVLPILAFTADILTHFHVAR
jgi:hypothetical protein